MRRWLAAGTLVGACLLAWLIASRAAVPNPTLATVAVGMYPSAIAVDSGAGRALVLNLYDTTVSVIDEITARVVATTTVGSNGGAHPQDLALDTRLGHAFVTTDDGEVSMLDSRSGRVLHVTRAGSGVGAIAICERTGRAFIADLDAGSVAVIDAATGTLLRTVSVGASPVTIVCDAPARRVFVADQGDGTVAVLDARSGRPLRSLLVGDAPVALAISDRYRGLLVAGAHGSLVGLDIETGALRFRRAPFGQRLSAIDLRVAADDPAGYALAGWGTRLLRIDPRTGATRGAIRLPSPLAALGVDPSIGYPIAAVRGPIDARGDPFGDGSLVRIGPGGGIVDAVTVAIDPSAFAVDSARHRLFVVNTNLNPDGSVPHPRPPPGTLLTTLGAWLRGWIPGIPPATFPPGRSGSVTVLRLADL